MTDSRRLAIVLVRPHLPSNLGSVARVAKNFGVSDLRLVEPAAAADEEAERLSSGAQDVLAQARRYPSLPEAVEEFPAVLTTTSLRGRGRHRARDLSELPDLLAEVGGSSRIALVFGPERSGLTEEELARSSARLNIATEPQFPTMNLSHAVAVVLATALLARRPRARTRDASWAPAREVEGMMEHWDRALDAIGFYDTGHRTRSLRDWRSLVAGRPLTEREVAMLRGVANRILVSLKRRRNNL
ncbi:MAG TPA: TrmH family RNA methyltransferase [Thermoanaerobaculia bacterium]|nr:TrmH family RNA methyltransferase [Thermoanaerobaculia bacterium]